MTQHNTPTLFRDLAIGQTFDFVNDAQPTFNSYYKRCVKTGVRTYQDVDDRGPHGYTLRIGSVSAKVYHVNH